MDSQAIEDLLCDIHAKRRGNSVWPPLFMFKALLLQSWHNLSDPGLEKQIDWPNKYKEGNSTQDTEADYNVKQGSDGKRKTTYGFKPHSNVDKDDVIKAIAFTAGNVHDFNHFTELHFTAPTKAESMMNGLRNVA